MPKLVNSKLTLLVGH